MQELYGKRLLVLGGTMWRDIIRRYADDYGIVLIAAGNDEHTPLREIADEYLKVDTTDHHAMKQLIADQKIDGVYMGGNEAVISQAVSYINELGLPCYCTKEQWEGLHNKIAFKKMCQEAGLPTVPFYDYGSSRMQFPVITKPADGCGSSGFSICSSMEELEAGYKKAKLASLTGNVLIEKYVKNESVVVFYTLSGGKLYFSGLEDKYTVQYKQHGSYVAGLLTLESDLSEDFRSRFEEKIRKMCAAARMSEGTFWIEVFLDGEQYYFNEAGYRYGGSMSMYPAAYFYGIHQTAMDICYALTGSSADDGCRPFWRKELDKKSHYAIYVLHLSSGTIAQICGVHELLQDSRVAVVPVAKKLGDTIEDTGTFSQVFGLVHFTYDTWEELKQMVHRIHQTVKVLDGQGRNLINPMLDMDALAARQEKKCHGS